MCVWCMCLWYMSYAVRMAPDAWPMFAMSLVHQAASSLCRGLYHVCEPLCCWIPVACFNVHAPVPLAPALLLDVTPSSAA